MNKKPLFLECTQERFSRKRRYHWLLADNILSACAEVIDAHDAVLIQSAAIYRLSEKKRGIYIKVGDLDIISGHFDPSQNNRFVRLHIEKGDPVYEDIQMTSEGWQPLAND